MSQSDSNRLLEFIEEDNGSLSATRLAFLMWAIGVLLIWGIESFRQNMLQSIGGDVATILGILMTGKVVQKFGEKPDNNQTPAESINNEHTSNEKNASK